MASQDFATISDVEATSHATRQWGPCGKQYQQHRPEGQPEPLPPSPTQPCEGLFPTQGLGRSSGHQRGPTGADGDMTFK